MAAKKANTLNGAVRKLLDGLDEADVKDPPIPVANLLDEARTLARVAAKDKAALKKVGLDTKLVGALPGLIDALADAQATMHASWRNLKSAQEVALTRDAIALRSEMVACLRHATRDDAEAQKAIDAVTEGEGLADLTEDLVSLAALYKAWGKALKRVGAPPSDGPRAAKLAAALSTAMAERRSTDGDDVSARLLRNRVATVLASSLSEIRLNGRFAFRRDAARRARYSSEYNANHRGNGAAAKAADAKAPA